MIPGTAPSILAIRGAREYTQALDNNLQKALHEADLARAGDGEHGGGLGEDHEQGRPREADRGDPGATGLAWPTDRGLADSRSSRPVEAQADIEARQAPPKRRLPGLAPIRRTIRAPDRAAPHCPGPAAPAVHRRLPGRHRDLHRLHRLDADVAATSGTTPTRTGPGSTTTGRRSTHSFWSAMWRTVLITVRRRRRRVPARASRLALLFLKKFRGRGVADRLLPAADDGRPGRLGLHLLHALPDRRPGQRALTLSVDPRA